MNNAYEKLIQHFDANEIRYLTNGDSQTVWADFRGAVGSYRVVAAVGASDGLFQVFGYSPVYVRPFAGSIPSARTFRNTFRGSCCW